MGEVEEETVKESTRYDAAGDTPKGVQLASQLVQRHLVMPAELQRQERFRCFVQLSGAWPIAQTTLPHPSTIQRQPIAQPIVPAKPEETFAARVADVPDPPPEDASKGNPLADETASTESRSTTSAAPASSGKAGADSISAAAAPPAIAPPASPAETIKGRR